MKIVLATALAAALSLTPALAAGPMLPPSPAAPVSKKTGPVVDVCMGVTNGSYYRSLNLIARMNRKVTFNPRTTNGAKDNVRLVTDGTCALGFTQADAVRVYREEDPTTEVNLQRVTATYKEYAHLLCNRKAGIGKVQQLTDKHVIAIGDEGSGSSVSWAGLVASDKKRYGTVKTSDLAGLDAVMAVADGAEVSCMLYMGGLGNTLLKKQAQKVADKVVLVPLNDGDFGNEKDAKGDSIYSYVSLPASTYGGLQPSGLFGKTEYKTVSTDMVIVVNRNWKAANPEAYTSILESINAATPAIIKSANPTE